MIKVIQEAIDKRQIIKFDYVSADMAVSFNRLVDPKEIKGPYLYGTDMNKNLLRRFLIDGIQKLQIVASKLNDQKLHQ